MNLDWGVVARYGDDLLRGAGLTLVISLICAVLSFGLGVLTALARGSSNRLLQLASTTYVEVFRNTPALLQIFFVYFALPSLGLRLAALPAGILALTLNNAAYGAEIIRAGIASIPHAQTEAASALGLSRRHVFTRVVFPQAIRNVYPPLINQLTILVLGTSLLSVISVPELTGTALTINSLSLRTVEIFAAATLLYLGMTTLGTFAMRALALRIFPRIPVR